MINISSMTTIGLIHIKGNRRTVPLTAIGTCHQRVSRASILTAAEWSEIAASPVFKIREAMDTT